jgi:hypothetical protein
MRLFFGHHVYECWRGKLGVDATIQALYDEVVGHDYVRGISIVHEVTRKKEGSGECGRGVSYDPKKW